MKSAHGIVNLVEEIELRRRLGEAFDSVLSGLIESETPAEVNLLASLLVETIEVRKRAEREEKELKKRLRACFGSSDSLDLTTAFAFVERIIRTDIDREALIKDIPDALTRYGKQTIYEKMTVKRKDG